MEFNKSTNFYIFAVMMLVPAGALYVETELEYLWAFAISLIGAYMLNTTFEDKELVRPAPVKDIGPQGNFTPPQHEWFINSDNVPQQKVPPPQVARPPLPPYLRNK